MTADGPSPARKLSDADRLATLKRIAEEARERAWPGLTPGFGKRLDTEDEIAAIEWAVAAAERERVLAVALENLVAVTEDVAEIENTSLADTEIRAARKVLNQAALDRAGKGETDG